MDEIIFTINNIEYRVKSGDVPIETSLNTFIREYAQLRGTKFMCNEGACGICNVTVQGIHPVTKEKQTWGVNSCLFPVLSCHDLNITTVEGLGNKNGYDKVQTRLVLMNGIQCGYCSPGMIMNMHSLVESKNGKVTMEDVENSFGGNLCRCTGYRPILDAFKSLTTNADPKLLENFLLKDIEDLKLCPKTKKLCEENCTKEIAKRSTETPINLKFENNQQWIRVYTIQEIFDIFKRIDELPYMLVSGNTADGVYRRDPNIKVFIDVTAVQQLRFHEINDEVVVGANVSLTELTEIFDRAATTNSNFKYLNDVNKHISLIGNISVRNIGTIAGNLSIKHELNKFQSDLFLVLETINAKVNIVNNDNSEYMSLHDFLAYDMKHRVIAKVIIPQYSPETFVYRSYKIMPRAQNALGYVNAAFLLQFNSTKTQVLSARICYGGINPQTIHADLTEKHLIGKDLYTTATLQSALSILNGELKPDWELPDASPEFRKSSALSLFYKFVISTAPEGKIRPDILSGGNVLERGLSSGTQMFSTQPDRYPLSEVIPQVDGFVKAGGETPFTNDLPKQPGEMWLAVVHATKVHANILDFDATEALKIPGVRAFLSSKDIPGLNSFVALKLDFEPEELLCSNKVLFNGQPAGLIVANSNHLANYAASLVKIIYSESLDLILPTMNDVFKANATDRIYERDFNMVAKEYGTDIRYKIEGRFEVGSQFHMSMEPQTCVAIPSEDGITVYASTQWMNHCQISISQLLKLPENRINMECRRIGGGFGGKQSRSSFAACAASLACFVLNIPIRFVMSMESNMKAIGKRYSCIGNYEVEVDSNGKIQKLFNKYYTDHGYSFNDPVEWLITAFFINCYDNRSWDVRSNAIKSDSPSNTFVRGPGTCEGMAMIENIMEHIAHVTGQDAIDVRMQNIPNDNPIKIQMPKFVTSVDYYERKSQIDTFNTNNRWIKRGISIMPIQYPQNFFGHFPALVSIYHGDGTVSIVHGGIEMGQGVTTKVVQVAAHTLGVPVEMIAIKPVNNVVSPNTAVSGGSVVSDSAAIAVLGACKMLNERIEPVRKELGSTATWQEITKACNDKHINLSALYLETVDEMKNYNAYGVACAEIEVDLLTGNFILQRVDILEDVGESYSPLTDVGQVEGAFVMGMGFWLTEELIYGEDGGLLSNRTLTYNAPGAKDIPVDFRVTFIKDYPNPDFVLKSKITGEPPICMAPVVVFALRHALMSARKNAGLTDAWYDLKAPYTVENIFLNAMNDYQKYVL